MTSKQKQQQINHLFPCLYCNIQISEMWDRPETEEDVITQQNKSDYNTFMIRLHMFEEHKDKIFTLKDEATN